MINNQGPGETPRRLTRHALVQHIEQDNEIRYSTAEWDVAWATFPSVAYWQEIAETAAQNACRAQGYPSVSNVVVRPGHNNDAGSKTSTNDRWRGDNLGWFFVSHHDTRQQLAGRQSRNWAATCKKVIRRTRK